MSQPGILIIAVIYNTYEETLRYLESIAKTGVSDLTLILADNSDKENSQDFLVKVKKYPFVQYMKTGKNLGYFGGTREGLKHYLQNHSTYPPWILVTNVDIVFTPEFFDRLNKLNNQLTLGIVAPSIISQKWNTDYNPKILVRYSKRKLELLRLLYSNFLLQNLYLMASYAKKWSLGLLQQKNKEGNNPMTGRRKIYAPHGSCLVFKNTYFSMGGTLDLPNFLFGEEVHVAENAARLGLDVIYDPELVIYDYEHASIGFFVTPKINRYYKESIEAILEKFYQ